MKHKIILLLIFFILLILPSNVNGQLNSDFLFDDNLLYSPTTIPRPPTVLYIEGQRINRATDGYFHFDLNKGSTVRQINYQMGTLIPPANTTYTGWYIQPLDDLLYSLWSGGAGNNTLGPLIMTNLNIIGTGCTDNPTCYASNVSKIIHEGDFDNLLNYIRPDDHFLVYPRSSYIDTNDIIFISRSNIFKIERINPNGTRTLLQWDTTYPLTNSTLRVVMTTPVHTIQGHIDLDLFIDTDNSLVAFVILMSVLGLILLFYAYVTPDYYIKLVLLFFSGFFFIITFLLTNSFYGTTYFNIASFMGVAYSMMGIVLLGLFIYLFFSMGIIFAVMPIVNRMIGNGKKKK